jgi:hypothetical protein
MTLYFCNLKILQNYLLCTNQAKPCLQLAAKLDRLLIFKHPIHFDSPMYEVGMYDLGDVVHLYVHANQLRKIKVHFVIVKAEHLVGDVALHTGLFAFEQVVHRHRHIEHFALQQPEHPETFRRLTTPLAVDDIVGIVVVVVVASIVRFRRHNITITDIALVRIETLATLVVVVRQVLDARLPGGVAVAGAAVAAAQDTGIVRTEAGQLVPLRRLRRVGRRVHRLRRQQRGHGLAFRTRGHVHFGYPLEGGVQAAVAVVQGQVVAGGRRHLGHRGQQDSH